MHPHDLRAIDVLTPKRRRTMLRRLALRLLAVSQDAESLQELILDARRNALDDAAAAI